jgi:UDP-N-acetylmuramoylalanine--D-glutamate ligase
MAGYRRAKRRILRNQGASDWAVIGVDDDHGIGLAQELRAKGAQRVLPVAVGRPVEQGIYVIDGRLFDGLDQAGREVADLRPIESLRGAHNWQNAAAAYGVARVLGGEPAALAAGLAAFPGLAHRMELAATIGGVRFVNDSKATNPEAAAKALATFERIHWIAGGRAKEGGLEALRPWLSRIRRAYLIGEAADEIAGFLADRVPVSRAGDLTTAVQQAAAAARIEAAAAPVVLLSPACASFDQFADFEARGDAFKALVDELAMPAEAPPHMAAPMTVPMTSRGGAP